MVAPPPPHPTPTHTLTQWHKACIHVYCQVKSAAYYHSNYKSSYTILCTFQMFRPLLYFQEVVWYIFCKTLWWDIKISKILRALVAFCKQLWILKHQPPFSRQTWRPQPNATFSLQWSTCSYFITSFLIDSRICYCSCISYEAQYFCIRVRHMECGMSLMHLNAVLNKTCLVLHVIILMSRVMKVVW